MKYFLILATFFAFDFSEIDCFNYAIESLERAESFRGSMMTDEEATDHMNWAYARCETSK